MSWDKVLENLIKDIGTTGVNKLEEIIGDLKDDAKEPWKKVILNMSGDLLSKYGLEGVSMLEKLVDDIAGGKKVDLSFATLRDRSDYLASIQNMEADDKKKARDFFIKLSRALGDIISVIVGGMLA